MYFVKLHPHITTTVRTQRHREFSQRGGAFHLVTCCCNRRGSNITSFINMSAVWRLKYKVDHSRLLYAVRSRRLRWFLWCHCGGPRFITTPSAVYQEETKNYGSWQTSRYQPRHLPLPVFQGSYAIRGADSTPKYVKITEIDGNTWLCGKVTYRNLEGSLFKMTHLACWICTKPKCETTQFAFNEFHVTDCCSAGHSCYQQVSSRTGESCFTPET